METPELAPSVSRTPQIEQMADELQRAQERIAQLSRENDELAAQLAAARSTLASVHDGLAELLDGHADILGAEAEPAEPANLLAYPYVQGFGEKDGIVWTDLGQGRIEADGTAAKATTFGLTRPLKRTDFATGHRRYVVSIGAEGTSPATWYISGAIGNKDGTGSRLLRKAACPGSDPFAASFEIDTAGYDYFGRLYIVVKEGQRLDHQVFAPMICPAVSWNGEWVPYSP